MTDQARDLPESSEQFPQLSENQLLDLDAQAVGSLASEIFRATLPFMEVEEGPLTSGNYAADASPVDFKRILLHGYWE